MWLLIRDYLLKIYMKKVGMVKQSITQLRKNCDI